MERERKATGALLPGAFSYEIIFCGSDDEVANVLTEAAAARKVTFGRVVATRVEDLPAIIASLPKASRGFRVCPK